MILKRTFRIACLVLIVHGTGCTKLARTKRWGFQETVTLPAGRKLVNATRKDSNLWVLTRPAAAGEVTDAEWSFDEHSSWGMLSGKLILRETPR